MTSQTIFTRGALFGAVVASLILTACASGPETPAAEPRAEIVAEPVTGTNIPRRDRKAVSNVTVTGPGAVKDALGKPQTPSGTN